jgi:hypothetical protein
MRFQILTAASMKIGAFSDTASCCLVDADLRFTGAYCLHRQVDEAIHTSEMLVYSETTWCYIPEGCNHLLLELSWLKVFNPSASSHSGATTCPTAETLTVMWHYKVILPFIISYCYIQPFFCETAVYIFMLTDSGETISSWALVQNIWVEPLSYCTKFIIMTYQ